MPKTAHLLIPVLLVSFACLAACFGQVIDKKDAYGGIAGLSATNTGWFHVDDIEGRWYFITPEGNAFFSLGVTHAVDCIRRDELGVHTTKHGNDEARLAAFLLGRLQEWGYNSAGYGALASMESQVPYVAVIPTEGPRSFSAGANSEYADIFDLAVQERLRRRVCEAAERHVENAFCLGYVFIDLPVWSAVPVRGESYVDFIRSLAPGAPGRTAYVDFLAERYERNIDLFTAAYRLETASFDALLAADLSGIRPEIPQVSQDDELFLNTLADTYYTCVVGELRARDPHHLILGDRFMALPDRTPDSILKTASKYVDVISFQPMGTLSPLRSYIEAVFRLTGKPVLLADVNTMTRRPEQNEADTTEYERSAGEHTLAYYLDAASSPYCIGIHRCTFRDYQPWNTQYHRRGLLKADDTPYSLLVDYTRRTNARVFEVVYEGIP